MFYGDEGEMLRNHLVAMLADISLITMSRRRYSSAREWMVDAGPEVYMKRLVRRTYSFLHDLQGDVFGHVSEDGVVSDPAQDDMAMGASIRSIRSSLSVDRDQWRHVLEATRPWLWENVDVLSGRGWLSVVNALTEEVEDKLDEEPGEPEDVEARLAEAFVGHENAASGSSSEGSGSANGSAHGTPKSPFDAAFGRHTDMLPDTPATSASSSTSVPPIPPASFGQQPPTIAPSQPLPLPLGLGKGKPPLQRSVTINAQVAEAFIESVRNEPMSAGHASHRFGPTPQPRRLSMLITPPGSRNNSPAGPRLRGRSRSPRRGLDFSTEGITSVLQRSLSLSLPGDQRPFARHSSLSHSRVFRDDEQDEDLDVGHRESLMAGMRTPPNLESPPAEPTEEDPTPNVNPELLPPPGPYIRHLSFTNFRTIGSRRSQDEAVRGRYVTAGRLEGVIKNTPNLRSLCMTEYVDSALSYAVVEEIFFRGYPKPKLFRNRSSSKSPATIRARSVSVAPVAVTPQHLLIEEQMDPPRPTYVPYEDETDEEKWKRRRVFSPLEALDLTGCVSRNFTEAVDEFGENWLSMGIQEESEDEDRHRGRSRRRLTIDSSTDEDEESKPLAERRTRRPLFSALRRLSLRTCTTLSPPFIQNLISVMPNLTHLDLSATRVTDSLLQHLIDNCPRGLRLQSLSLARCPRLDPRVVVDFLVESPAARNLIELNLFVNPTQGNAIEEEDMFRLIKDAPCFKSGRLRYLDISSAGITADHLDSSVFPPQPSLMSLGLSHIPTLRLRPIAAFLQNMAPGVEVLTLAGTALSDLRPNATTMQNTLALLSDLVNPLTKLPFSIGGLGLLSGSNFNKPNLSAGPTRLRVIELSSGVRRAIAPSPEWMVISSKGGRGWCVDVTAGWVPADTVDTWGYVPAPGPATVGEGLSQLSFVRHLPFSHPRRKYLTQLSDLNGRVSSSVGWHSRKMEVIKGEGMMGREDGMGGVGAFAFDD
ncbi:hypothetical protein Q8F55_007096 [Vanrija albida]|uniref:F-box domain-containing protein n=1 Tax=Vanrija albida TaxID=181172 RepID=A0ABR3PYW6_9TREE